MDVRVLEDPAPPCAEMLSDAAASGADIALTGGSTPERAYARAAELEQDWSRARLWWGDDRCVPPDDELSNYRLAKEALLDRIETPPAEVHRIRGELAPGEAARELDEALEGVQLDLLLLGLGSDGHMASLFAGSPQLEVVDRRATSGPAGLEPFVDRVTMTLPTIQAASQIVFIVGGADKADAVAAAFGSEPSHETPASLARLAPVDIRVFLDGPAASKLPGR